VRITSATAISTKMATLRIWKSTGDQSCATLGATALRPRIAIAGHQ
jgi:hypothetical protein